MKPSVGRIVRYSINEREGRVDYPAIVTGVHGDVVSLTAFTFDGPVTRGGIPHSEYPKAAYWSWPPRD